MRSTADDGMAPARARPTARAVASGSRPRQASLPREAEPTMPKTAAEKAAKNISENAPLRDRVLHEGMHAGHVDTAGGMAVVPEPSCVGR